MELGIHSYRIRLRCPQRICETKPRGRESYTNNRQPPYGGWRRNQAARLARSLSGDFLVRASGERIPSPRDLSERPACDRPLSCFVKSHFFRVISKQVAGPLGFFFAAVHDQEVLVALQGAFIGDDAVLGDADTKQSGAEC